MQRQKRIVIPAAATVATDESDSPPYSSPLLPNLPDDVALQCIARVPHFYHAELSLVSKSWCSLFRSPIFYSIRKRLNCTQHVLYLNVDYYPPIRSIGSTNKWLALDIDPSNPKNPRNLSLPSIPTSIVRPKPFFICSPSIAVLGPKIYFLGGSIDPSSIGDYSSTFWIMDCRIRRWEIGPKMGIRRRDAAAAVLNGKIYVMGGCFLMQDSSNWAEVFDPELGYWVTVPTPDEFRLERVLGTAVVGEKFYVWGHSYHEGPIIFDPCDSSWHQAPTWLGKNSRINGRGCVVDGILYRPDNFDLNIQGLDMKVGKWQTLNLVHKDWINSRWLRVGTMNVGGRLCVVWVERRAKEEYRISCAEVEVGKDSNGGLWGSIAPSQLLMLIPNKFQFGIWCSVEL